MGRYFASAKPQVSDLRLPSNKFVMLPHKFACEKSAFQCDFSHCYLSIIVNKEETTFGNKPTKTDKIVKIRIGTVISLQGSFFSNLS